MTPSTLARSVPSVHVEAPACCQHPGRDTEGSASMPPQRTPADTAHVYFIQSADGGPVKIGVARDVNARLADLQAANPERLVVTGVICGGGFAREAELHNQFAADRIRGEWFHPTEEICRIGGCRQEPLADFVRGYECGYDTASDDLSASVDRWHRRALAAQATLKKVRTSFACITCGNPMTPTDEVTDAAE